MTPNSHVFSVLIVDDERATREGLAARVLWEDLGMRVVGLAEDGRMAVRMVAEHRPDIVLTDVRMPRMDGIALATAIRESAPATEVVFLSGYSDREYLLSAIKLRAFDYVEKPVSLDELTATLRGLRDKLAQERGERDAARHRLVSVLLSGPTEIESRDAMVASGVDEDTISRTIVVVAKMRGPNLASANRGALMDAVRSAPNVLAADLIVEDLVLLVDADGVPAIAAATAEVVHEQLESRGLGPSCAIGVGTAAGASDLLRESHRKALLALRQAFCRGWGRTYTYRAPCKGVEDLVPLNLDGIRVALEANDPRAALNTLASLRNKLRITASIPEGTVRDFYSRVLSLAEDSAERQGLSSGLSGTSREFAAIRSSASLDEIHEIVSEAVSDLFLPAADFGRTRRLVYEMEQYVRRSQEIVPTLADAAVRFRMSSPHLSRVFKSEMRVGFTDFVKQTKVDQAKVLLRDVTLRISEVADKLGYDDRRYFTRVFRERTGMSPRDYRERVL